MDPLKDIDIIEAIDNKLGKIGNDCWIDGVKYRKYNGFYFKWERIKWRILQVDEDKQELLLIADKVLDSKKFAGNTHEDETGKVTEGYKDGLLRAFLNGYRYVTGEYSGYKVTDYSIDGNNFLTTAFSTTEREELIPTNVFSNVSADKVRILSKAEATNASYGFDISYDVNDSSRYRIPTEYSYCVACESAYYVGCKALIDRDFKEQIEEWWLADDSYKYAYAQAVVGKDGYYGGKIDSTNGWSKTSISGVVPVIRISMNSPLIVHKDDQSSGAGGEKLPIMYDANGGSRPTENPSYYFPKEGVASFADSVREGYTFEGWYLDRNFRESSRVTSIKGDKYGNVVLYAKWKANEYKISYELDGGKNNISNPSVFTYGVGVSDFKAPIKEGATFDG